MEVGVGKGRGVGTDGRRGGEEREERRGRGIKRWGEGGGNKVGR